jgi:hypothetical protein
MISALYKLFDAHAAHIRECPLTPIKSHSNRHYKLVSILKGTL